MNKFKDLIERNRSYRRFYQEYKIAKDTLTELVDLARLSPSGGNLQPLRFYLSWKEEKNQEIFDTLAWAGYLKDWNGPDEGERPSAYIIILADESSPKPADYDAGIAAQSILLGAVEKGLGGCMVGSVNRVQLKDKLNLTEDFRIMLVIALGKPKETISLEEMVGDDIKYWRDKEAVHHVPKRKLEDIILY